MAVNGQRSVTVTRAVPYRDLLRSAGMAQDGDPDGADAIVRICRADLVNYLDRRGASDPQGQAGDVLAEFLDRLPSLEFEHEQQIWAYLYRMCRSSLSRDSIRSGIEQPAGLVMEDEHADHGQAVGSVDDRLRVEEILDELTPAQAQILRYRFLEDRSVKDTAMLTGLSVTAVKSLQLRGLRAAKLAVLALSLAAIVLVGIMVIGNSEGQQIDTGPSSVDVDGSESDQPVDVDGSEPDQPVDVDGSESDQPVDVDGSEPDQPVGVDGAVPDQPVGVDGSEPGRPVETDERGGVPGEGAEVDRSGPVPQESPEEDNASPAPGLGIVMRDDFTVGVQPAAGQFVDVGPGDQLGGWTVRTSVSIDDAAHHGRSDAGRYLDLDDDGEVTRTVGGLIPGVVYEVRLDAARHPGVTTASAVVEIDGSVLAIQPQQAVGDGFATFTFTFTASADEVRLTLRGTGSSQPWGGVLVNSVVIEPFSGG